MYATGQIKAKEPVVLKCILAQQDDVNSGGCGSGDDNGDDDGGRGSGGGDSGTS